MTASLFYKNDSELAEGPMWHKGRRSFFWVDILGELFYEYGWNDKKVTVYRPQRLVSVVYETADINKVILAAQGGLFLFNLSNGESELLQAIERDKQTRTNDGGYDPAGRIWIGTMGLTHGKNEGALYCYSKKAGLVKKLDSLTIPNGIAWSKDGKTMYHVETTEYVVNAYDFDNATGNIKFRKVAIHVPGELGFPDGMCMDEEGMLWIAHWGGFGVCRWNPLTGELLGKIDVPVPHVSSCTFGGDDMKTLLITTARENLSRDDIRRYPESGSIFIAG
ncbi:MAG: SMP-30/gluconolactonase/LRE family protein [Chitinophagaceae bacterium]|nr:SMP-30/gluconolactonase/LRE family protein [Chitinophagaceae bacterium]